MKNLFMEYKEVIIDCAVIGVIAAGSLLVGKKIGEKETAFKFNCGLSMCFEVDPTLKEHVQNAIEMVKKKD